MKNKPKNKTKKELVNSISKKTGFNPEDINLVVTLLGEEILNSLAQNRNVELRTFGSFKSIIRKQKVGRNPKLPAKQIIIPEHRAVVFTPSKLFKSIMKQQD